MAEATGILGSLLCASILFGVGAAQAAEPSATERQMRIVEAFLDAGAAGHTSGVSSNLHYLADGKPILAAKFWKALEGCRRVNIGLVEMGYGRHSVGEAVSVDFECTGASRRRTDPEATFRFAGNKMSVAEVALAPIPTVTLPGRN
jgi:hypothetical protein